MDKKTIIVSLIVLIAGISTLIFLSPDKIVIEESDILLFEKMEHQSLFNSGQRSTRLYYSGKVIIQEGESVSSYQLKQEDVTQIITKLEYLMNQSCSAEAVLDYSATYIILIGNRVKIIKFPGCKLELDEIEKFI